MRIIRIAVLALLLAAGSLMAVPAEAATPLPSGRFLFDSNRTGNYEIYSANSDGTGVTQLTSNTTFDTFWPKLSPDRTKIVFHRTPVGSHDVDYTHAGTWKMDADGANVVNIIEKDRPGWTAQAHVEWSPDGTKLALIGGDQIYITNANGQNPVRVTRDALGGPRQGSNIDPSWAPDGNSLLFVGCPVPVCGPNSFEVYKVNLDGTGETRLTNDLTPDYDPYYAPNSSKIAWLRNTGNFLLGAWAVMKMNTDGSAQTAVIDDGGINSKPDWAVGDSTNIYFHRQPPAFSGQSNLFNVYKINVNGTGLTRILPDHGGAYVNEYPEF